MKDVSKIVKRHINESISDKLNNREERMEYNGDIYDLCIYWREEDFRNNICATTPYYAYIRKNGKNFADITVYSNELDCIFIKQHTARLFAKPEWKIKIHKNINTVPFEYILNNLPVEETESLSEADSNTKSWEVRFKEVGHKPSSTTHTGYLQTEKEVVDFFGLEEDDIEWYEIEEIE